MRLMRFRHSISHKVFRVLADYSWHILVAAGIGAFALGCVGYWTYLSGQHKAPSLSDVAYASMQLFFGTTMAETHLPTSLNIARFLAFIVTGWAGVLGDRSSVCRPRTANAYPVDARPCRGVRSRL